MELVLTRGAGARALLLPSALLPGGGALLKVLLLEDLDLWGKNDQEDKQPLLGIMSGEWHCPKGLLQFRYTKGKGGTWIGFSQ